MSLASYTFLFAFLPAVALLTGVVARVWGRGPAKRSLLLASLVFYSMSAAPSLVLVFLVSASSYLIAAGIHGAGAGQGGAVRARSLLCLGIGINLALLVYFRIGLGAGAPGLASGLSVRTALPIGISFIAFQQLAYLVDVYRGDAPASSLGDYALLVFFFPKVAAGPLVRHADFLSEVASATFRIHLGHVAAGTTLFLIGLAKKVLIADRLAVLTSTVFRASEHGVSPTFSEAWLAAIGYGLQIYFDFSGYSDMAIGAGKMFGIQLPVNFRSPYKAASVAEFWKRWHITLSSLFFDFVYFPLVMAARGRYPAAPYIGLVATMLLCALWHGVGVTYVLWGLLHAAYLSMNHGWRALRKHHPRRPHARAGHIVSVAATFIAVTVAWVPFQAATVASSIRMWASMSGLNGLDLGVGTIAGVPYAGSAALAIPIGLMIVWLLPNSQEFVGLVRDPRSRPFIRWRPSVSWAISMGLLAAASFLVMDSRPADFIYFRF